MPAPLILTKMKINKHNTGFKPIDITIETREELDDFYTGIKDLLYFYNQHMKNLNPFNDKRNLFLQTMLNNLEKV